MRRLTKLAHLLWTVPPPFDYHRQRMPVLIFTKCGAIPHINLIVGQTAVAEYSFVLWKPDRTNPRISGAGAHTDDIEDTFPLTVAKKDFHDTDTHVLDGVIRINCLQEGKRRYDLDVEITQDGVLIDWWRESAEMTTSRLTRKRSWTIKLV